MKWIVYSVVCFALVLTACKGGEKVSTTTENGKPAKEEKPTCLALVKDGKPVFDEYKLVRHTIRDNCLVLYISHSGGCKEHVFELQWNGAWMKSLPPQVNMTLSHDGNRDVCREYKEVTQKYDLAAIQMSGQEKTIINLRTGLKGDAIRIEYNYGTGGTGVPSDR